MTNEEIVEAVRRMKRTAEMSAEIMRDRQRTGAWEGAEKVARQFDRLAERASDVFDALTAAQAENEKLRAAAQPFIDEFNRQESGYYCSDEEIFPRTRITYGDYHNLRNVFALSPPPLSPEK